MDGLSALNNISSQVTERNQRIFANKAHVECVKKEIDKFNNIINLMRQRIVELDAENEQNETFIELIRNTNETLQETLVCTRKSVSFLNELKVLKTEKLEAAKLENQIKLREFEANYEKHRAQCESTNDFFKQVQEASIELKKLQIREMDLRKKISIAQNKKNQMNEIRKQLFYNDFVKFAEAVILQQQSVKAFTEFKALQEEERSLVRKFLDMQETVRAKERQKRTDYSRNKNTGLMPKIDFSQFDSKPNMMTPPTKSKPKDCNSKEKQKITEIVRKNNKDFIQKIDFSKFDLKPNMMTNLESTDTTYFKIPEVKQRSEEVQRQLLPEKNDKNVENSLNSEELRRLKFNEAHTKIRILDVSVIEPQKATTTNIEESVSDKVMKAVQRISRNLSSRNKTTIKFSKSSQQTLKGCQQSPSCSQESQRSYISCQDDNQCNTSFNLGNISLEVPENTTMNQNINKEMTTDENQFNLQNFNKLRQLNFNNFTTTPKVTQTKKDAPVPMATLGPSQSDLVKKQTQQSQNFDISKTAAVRNANTEQGVFFPKNMKMSQENGMSQERSRNIKLSQTDNVHQASQMQITQENALSKISSEEQRNIFQTNTNMTAQRKAVTFAPDVLSLPQESQIPSEENGCYNTFICPTGDQEAGTFDFSAMEQFSMTGMPEFSFDGQANSPSFPGPLSPPCGNFGRFEDENGAQDQNKSSFTFGKPNLLFNLM